MLDDAESPTLAHLLLELGKATAGVASIDRQLSDMRVEQTRRETEHNTRIEKIEQRLSDLEENEHQRDGRTAMIGWLGKLPGPIWAALAVAGTWLATHLGLHPTAKS